MRISDWSSDVCSSDLIHLPCRRTQIGITQSRTEPDIGSAQAEVHVIGDDGAAIRSQRARDRKVVAPRRQRLGGLDRVAMTVEWPLSGPRMRVEAVQIIEIGRA